jgi:hypothetical protein
MCPITDMSGISDKSDIEGDTMKKLVIVSDSTKYRTLWEKAGGSGECPTLLRNTGTDWEKVGKSLHFWTKFAK